MKWTAPGLAAAAVVLAIAVPAVSQQRRPSAEPPPAPEMPADIRARASLSQTAAWVGDPVNLVVEIETAPGVEIVTDDLQADKLTVEGLDLGPAIVTEERRADGWRTQRYQYRLTAWDTTPPKQVGAITVRFRRPVTAATASGVQPAAEFTIPAVTLAMRSTLPDEGLPDGPRDRAAGLPPPGWLAWLRPAGLGLILLAIAPVVLWFLARARRPRLAKPRPSARSLQAHVKTLFDELQALDIASPEGRQRAYDRIDADLRAYLAEAEAVPAASLTADELRPRLAASTRVRADQVCDILAECEHARYGPVDRLPAADTLGGTIARLRAALGH